MSIPVHSSYVTCLDTASSAPKGDHNTKVILEKNTSANSLPENFRILSDILNSMGAETLQQRYS